MKPSNNNKVKVKTMKNLALHKKHSKVERHKQNKANPKIQLYPIDKYFQHKTCARSKWMKVLQKKVQVHKKKSGA